MLSGAGTGSVTAPLRPHRIDVDAIDLEVVLRDARAVHGNRLRVPSDTRVIREMRDGAWREGQHLGHIAAGQWQGRDCARVDHVSELRPACSCERRHRAHRRGFDHGRRVHVRIDRRGFGDAHSDIGELDGLKSPGPQWPHGRCPVSGEARDSCRPDRSRRFADRQSCRGRSSLPRRPGPRRSDPRTIPAISPVV